MLKLSVIVGASLLVWSTAQDVTHTFRTCRATNYVTENNKIYAVDPASGEKKLITIKGATWNGMETTPGVPNGLWGNGTGAAPTDAIGINGTTVSDMLRFLYNNKFNSIRLPLNADKIVQDAPPQVRNIHKENLELTAYPNGFTPKYSDLIARFVGAAQEYRISVLLDIHQLVDNFEIDAYWYYPTYTSIEETSTYKAVETLAKNYCNAKYWNIIGVDIKNAMSDAQWRASADEVKEKYDWNAAASKITNQLLTLCPQWLAFVGGSSGGAYTDSSSQQFIASNYSAMHWYGGSLSNATTRPLSLTVKNKVVFAPQVHTHGAFPQSFFYPKTTTCKKPEDSAAKTDCVVYVDGKLSPITKKMYRCQNSEVQCKSYTPLSKNDLIKNYEAFLQLEIGDVVKNKSYPVIFGQFSGVYGANFQPQQTIAMDYLINYMVTNLNGGYFASLNPDKEYYLEAPLNVTTGVLGKTRFGLMSATSWQVPNEDLLQALSTIPSTEIPCYGDTNFAKPGGVVESFGQPTSSISLVPYIVLGLLTYLAHNV